MKYLPAFYGMPAKTCLAGMILDVVDANDAGHLVQPEALVAPR